MHNLGVLVAGCLLAAMTVSPLEAQQAPDQAAQQEKKVCRSQKVTGSLTRRIRTCMTQAEWDRQAQGTQRGVDGIVRESQLRGAISCTDRIGYCRDPLP